jgi:hypothetical protein
MEALRGLRVRGEEFSLKGKRGHAQVAELEEPTKYSAIPAAPIHATPHFIAFFVPRVVVYASSQDFVETDGRPFSSTDGRPVPCGASACVHAQAGVQQHFIPHAARLRLFAISNRHTLCRTRDKTLFVRDEEIMDKGQLIGTIQAVVNIIPGILLSLFHKPIGSSMSAFGKKVHADRIFGAKLYEERNSRRFVLIVGVWLIVWGIIAFFLFSTIIGDNP